MYYYQQYNPSAMLAEHIECYWVFRSLSESPHRLERMIPGGRIELMFSFSGPFHWLASHQNEKGTSMIGAFIMGPRNRIYYVRASGNADIIGVRFKPGGLAMFTNMPAALLLNQIILAENVFGTGVTNFHELLYEAKNDGCKISLLDSFLLQSLKKNSPDSLVVRNMLEQVRFNHDLKSVQTVCNDAGWHYKKLERAFQKYVGYAPKNYCKIIRFNHALRMMADDKKSLTQICYDCNYFDQSHFNNDFNQLAGTAPGNFRREDNKIAALLIRHQAV